MKPTIGVLGGTGHEGSKLAFRWARAGYPLIIGSRDIERAKEVAKNISAALPQASIIGADNERTAADCTIAVLTVPHAAQLKVLEGVRSGLRGKILVNVTVPLVPPKVSRVQLPPEHSAVMGAQALLGETVKVVSAFQNVSSHLLEDDDDQIDCDVLVCGDDQEARSAVVDLVDALGMRGVHGGSLANSVASEALTSVLIFINRFYKLQKAGIRITGLSR